MKKFEFRENERYQMYEDLSVTYEGASEEIPVHPPSLSMHGMFINTPCMFPIGSVLKIAFTLQRTQTPIMVRAEVRHCTPGLGLGVEFLNLSRQAAKAIQKEIAGAAVPKRPVSRIGN